MENPNGDASKNEERPRSDVNKAQIEVINLDSPECEGLVPLIAEDHPVPNKEGPSSSGDVSMFDQHSAELELDSILPSAKIANMDFDSIVRVVYNRVSSKFKPERLLNQQQVVQIQNSIHAEGVLRDNNKTPPLEVKDYDQSLGKITSDSKMSHIKPDLSIGQGLGLGIGNFEDWEQAHGKGKKMSDFEMKDVKPDSSIGQGLGLGIGNFEEWEHAHAKGKTMSDFEMKDVKPDSSIGLRPFGQVIGDFEDSENGKNPLVTVYEHAEGKTISGIEMKDDKPDSSRELQLLKLDFEESEHAKNSPVPEKKDHCLRGDVSEYESLGKIISDSKMKHVKPDLLIGQGLGIGNFEEWEQAHAKGKTISDFEMKDVKPNSSIGQGLGLGIGDFEEWEHAHAKGKTMEDFEMKDVKPDLSIGLRLFGQVIGDFEDSENGKIPPVTVYEHAEGKRSNDIEMKDDKPDSSRELQLLELDIEESEHAKNSPVPEKKDNENAEGDALDQNKLQIEVEDSDQQDLRMTTSDIKTKDVKPESSRRLRVRFVMKNKEESEHGKDCPVPNKEGPCSSGDVPVNEYDAESNLNLAKLGKRSLRRYIKHFKIKGFNRHSSKEQMLDAVKQHFASQPPLDEQQVIPQFIEAARKNKA